MKLFNILLLTLSLLLPGVREEKPEVLESFDESQVESYDQDPWTVLNDNEPYFEVDSSWSREQLFFLPLDELGRTVQAWGLLGPKLLPKQQRESTASIEPSGWQSIEMANGEGGYLYNRCHLIGYQLCGDAGSEGNLITGTRYLNMQGMLPFENMTADYISETGHHVAYRVTPIYHEEDLLAQGVILEGRSIEDDEICFNVYCYNVQPDVKIDYATGKASFLNTVQPVEVPEETCSYILNSNTKKFHLPGCRGTKTMKAKNTIYLNDTREHVLAMGYVPCKICNP